MYHQNKTSTRAHATCSGEHGTRALVRHIDGRRYVVKGFYESQYTIPVKPTSVCIYTQPLELMSFGGLSYTESSVVTQKCMSLEPDQTNA